MVLRRFSGRQEGIKGPESGFCTHRFRTPMNVLPGTTMGTRIPGDPILTFMRAFKISKVPTSLLDFRKGQELVDLATVF